MANYVQTNKCHRYSEACNIILCEYEALEGCAYYIYLGKYACINDIICRGKISNIDMILCHMFLTVFDISCQNVIAYGGLWSYRLFSYDMCIRNCSTFTIP